MSLFISMHVVCVWTFSKEVKLIVCFELVVLAAVVVVVVVAAAAAAAFALL